MNHLFGWTRLMLLYFVIDVLCASQQTVKSETQQVKGIVGRSLSFPERVFKTGYLRYGEDTTANVINGQSHIDSEERFKNRIHWDNVTGLFSLSDLQIEDAGVYSVENKDGEKRIPKFNLTLYYVVSKPQVTECDNSSCSVVCSVDNEKEVTLTLYGGEEILNQTSSPDLTTDLSLRLEVEGKNYYSTYSCVAANPVSKETVHVPKCCSEDGHPKKSGKNSSERVQVDIEYATITYIEQTDNQEERRGVPELESRTDNPEMASVYDTLQLHRMAAGEDVDTA
ncbi:uncharacterized protein ACWYII_041199 isoform 4-T6 [Salvelinus alpinus]